MRTDRWNRYFYSMATLAAGMSKDTTKVGGVLVKDKTALLTAFNGPPSGVIDDPDRFVRPQKYLWNAHCEQNLISFAAREGIRTKGCLVYVTHHPCAACARMLIQSGVEAVYYGPNTTSMPDEEFSAAAKMFREARIACLPVDKTM